MCGRDPRAFEEIDLGRNRDDDCGNQETEADVGDGSYDGHALLHLRGRRTFGGFGRGEGEQAAGGDQKDAAQLEAEPCGGDGTGDLTHDNGHQEKHPEREAAATGGSGDGGVADGQAKQEQEEGVDTDIHPKESANRK